MTSRRIPSSVVALVVYAAVAAGCGHTLRAANPNVPVALPADHAAHRDAQTEWWHFHGHVTDDRGRHYDWFLAFIRQHTDRDRLWLLPLHWFVDPFQVAYFAVTDRSTGRYYVRELHAYPDVWAASASQDRLALRHNSWRAEMKDGQIELRARTRLVQLKLRLRALKPAALLGKRGYLYVPPRSSHYYYSIPRMASSGTIAIDGDKHKVSGLGWFKHEWGFLYSKAFAGWVWFGVQLSTGQDLEIALLFDRDWNLATGSFAVVEERDGRVTALPVRALEVKQLGRTWRSPRTNTVYPTAWMLEIPGRGGFSLQAVVGAQEMVVFPANLWAGTLVVRGELDGKQITGNTFTEVVGLDQPFGRALLRSGRPRNAPLVQPRERSMQ